MNRVGEHEREEGNVRLATRMLEEREEGGRAPCVE